MWKRLGPVQERGLVDVLRDGLHRRAEEHHVEARATPDRDQQQPPQHRRHAEEGLRVGGEGDRVVRVDQTDLDHQPVDQALTVASVDLLPHHGDDHQRQHLREEENNLVDAGTEHPADAGPVLTSAHIEQEREEQGQRDGEQRHGDQEEDVVPEGLPDQLIRQQPDVVVQTDEVLGVRVTTPVGQRVSRRLHEGPHHVEEVQPKRQGQETRDETRNTVPHGHSLLSWSGLSGGTGLLLDRGVLRDLVRGRLHLVDETAVR